MRTPKVSPSKADKSPGIHPNSRKNLVAPWPKGVSGNPGGRPKVDVAAEIARAVFEGNKEAVREALTRALLKGNAYVFKELAERGYGKVAQSLELTGDISLREIVEKARKRGSAARND